MKKRIFPFVVIVLLITTIIWYQIKNSENDMDIYSGSIEATLIPIQSEVPGRITNLTIMEGQKVSAGEVIANTDNQGAKIALAVAQSQLDQAEQKLADLVAGSRSQELRRFQANYSQSKAGLEQAKASIGQVRANQAQALNTQAQVEAILQRDQENLKYQEKQLNDAKSLFKEGAISTKELDTQTHLWTLAKEQLQNTQAQYDATSDQIDNLRAQLSSSQAQYKGVVAQAEAAKSNLDLALAGYTQPTIKAQKAAVDIARQGVNLAQINIDKTIIKSPIDGIVQYKYVEKGQVIAAGTRIVSVIDPKDLWVRVYVPEARLNTVSRGKKVQISIDALPGNSFSGEVVNISDAAEFTPKNIQTKEERTTLVFAVKVQIKEGFDVLKAGAPADVSFK